jgi:hypothetical protein
MVGESNIVYKIYTLRRYVVYGLEHLSGSIIPWVGNLTKKSPVRSTRSPVPVTFWLWRNNLRYCPMMTYPGRCFRHKIVRCVLRTYPHSPNAYTMAVPTDSEWRLARFYLSDRTMFRTEVVEKNEVRVTPNTLSPWILLTCQIFYTRLPIISWKWRQQVLPKRWKPLQYYTVSHPKRQ